MAISGISAATLAATSMQIPKLSAAQKQSGRGSYSPTDVDSTALSNTPAASPVPSATAKTGSMINITA
jgi:hypothetical protein